MTDDTRPRRDPAQWHRRVSAPWMLITGGALGVTALVMVLLALTPLVPSPMLVSAAALLLGAVAMLASGSVRVTVDPREVAVRSVCFPVFRRSIALARVTGAFAKSARPMELGGWGYRWLPRRSAVSLRAGDALWLRLDGGREFVVTVDDADRAARVVNANLGRTRGR
jgi:hypothetical protein